MWVLVEIMFLVEVELFYFKCCLIAVDEVEKKKTKNKQINLDQHQVHLSQHDSWREMDFQSQMIDLGVEK